MGKIRKRRLSSTAKIGMFYFLPCLIMYFICSIYLKSYNNSLSSEIQSKQIQIETIKQENQQLAIDIQTLQNKERVYTIAENSGLQQNQENIINIKGTEGNEAK